MSLTRKKLRRLQHDFKEEVNHIKLSDLRLELLFDKDGDLLKAREEDENSQIEGFQNENYNLAQGSRSMETNEAIIDSGVEDSNFNITDLDNIKIRVRDGESSVSKIFDPNNTSLLLIRDKTMLPNQYQPAKSSPSCKSIESVTSIAGTVNVVGKVNRKSKIPLLKQTAMMNKPSRSISKPGRDLQFPRLDKISAVRPHLMSSRRHGH